MNYENLKEATLMVWEENPSKRNQNNVIKFNLKSDLEAKEGDSVSCKLGGGQYSVYTITEVLEKRASSITGYNYITAKTTWQKN